LLDRREREMTTTGSGGKRRHRGTFSIEARGFLAAIPRDAGREILALDLAQKILFKKGGLQGWGYHFKTLDDPLPPWSLKLSCHVASKLPRRRIGGPRLSGPRSPNRGSCCQNNLTLGIIGL
jgi:hypothetical protein